MRLLWLAVGGIAVPLPPTTTLLVQAALLLASGSGIEGWCSAALLLRDPLSQQRLSAAASILDLGTLPVAALLAAACQGQPAETARPAPACTCQAVLAFLQAGLAVVVPLMLSAIHTQRWGRGGGGAALAMPRVAHLQHQAAPHIVFARELYSSAASCASRAAAAADKALGDVLLSDSGGGTAAHVLVAWWALSLAWLACKRLSGIGMLV